MEDTSDAVTGEIETRRGLFRRKTTMAVNLTKNRAFYCPLIGRMKQEVLRTVSSVVVAALGGDNAVSYDDDVVVVVVTLFEGGLRCPQGN